MEFELEAVGRDVIAIRWSKAFGPLSSPVYESILDCLHGVEGVDKIELLRYSALVKIATHMISPDLAVTVLGHALLEDDAVGQALREEASIEEIHIRSKAPAVSV